MAALVSVAPTVEGRVAAEARVVVVAAVMVAVAVATAELLAGEVGMDTTRRSTFLNGQQP